MHQFAIDKKRKIPADMFAFFFFLLFFHPEITHLEWQLVIN